jgi:hypothetical protein
LWTTAPIEIALLAALAIADPGRIDRRSQLLRGLSIVLTVLLAPVEGRLIESIVGAPERHICARGDPHGTAAGSALRSTAG